MGAPSELQPGDHLVAVEGIALPGGLTTAHWSLREDWQVGSTVRYTVLRGVNELQLNVPLTRWELWSFLRDGGIIGTNMVTYLGIVVFLGMGFLAFWRRPDVPAARALWVLGAVIFSITAFIDFLPIMIPDNIYPMASFWLNIIILLTFTILLPPALIRFALVFPKAKPI
jgi:glycopeptide antibiotics resistance protein